MVILKQEIDKVMTDRWSGSVLLLENLISTFESFCKRGFKLDQKQKVIDLLNSLQTGFRDFPVVLHFLHTSIQFLNESKVPGLLNFLLQYRKKWEDTGMQIAQKAKSLIDLSGKRILLHSSSGTIKRIFDSCSDMSSTIQVIQTESRPNLEGRKQAASLAKLGFQVLLLPDLGMGRHLKKIDLVLMGADMVSPRSEEHTSELQSH